VGEEEWGNIALMKWGGGEERKLGSFLEQRAADSGYGVVSRQSKGGGGGGGDFCLLGKGNSSVNGGREAFENYTV